MRFYYLLLAILLTIQIQAQERFTLSGYIKDAANGEGLIGVSVFVQEAKVGTQTNAYGFYSITLPSGGYNVSITYIGYQKLVQKVSLDNANLTKTFELKEDSQVLQEVVVSTKKEDDNVKSLEMSVNKIDIKTIQKMPALLGEVDIIKSIQFLPGVTTVGEGASGFNVRGGNVDQNLVLLDEAPVYNSSHLFGFFSVFNPDAVKDVKLYKGGIPAQYGGRISSILDVRMKEGNNKKLEVNGGIGTIFSRLSIEAPIVKDKGSFIIAGRRSYIDVLAKPFLKGDLKNAKFYYYDFTAKANYRINEKNNVYLSGYFGRDVFGADFGFNWGNATTTFRWNHVFNNKLFLNTTVFYSNYDYSLGTQRNDPNAKDSFNWSSNIINNSIKPDFSYYLNPKNTITFGGQATYYVFKPGLAIAKSAGETRTFGAPSKYGAEFATYIANEQKINDKLSLQYGLRYSYYQYLGKADSYTLDAPNTTGDRRNVLKIIPFGDNEVIADYGNFEPRFAMNLGLGRNSSMKLSYNRTAQYIHLLSNTTASSPLDVWTPSSNNIKPQIADQVALGYFYNFKDNDYESSVEVYYKDMQNQIDYVRGADLLLNPAAEADLIFGKGRAYGSEFYIKKNKGKFNGWISYTLARTERQMAGLNQGNWFPARVDKTHNISVVGIYDLNKKWSFSSNFTFFTGTPASFPTNKYIIQGVAIPHDYYDERNIYRISNYHRLDLAATLKPNRKLFKKGQGEYVFSIYNTYNRKNAFSEYVRQNPDDPSKTEAIRYAVFGSIIPAVTYNFKF